MTYQINISAQAQKTIRTLPGNVRQRIRRTIKSLGDNPRPANSKKLNFNLTIAEPRRIRIDKWRIVYAIINADIKIVAIVAIRKRPPYDYTDLSDLFSNLE